jgi:uncharacterized protein YbjT (DUF2867 family)
MNILILGATGFIGSEIARRLAGAGHAVSGLGRDIERARNLNQNISWLKADLNALQQASDWTHLLASQDVIINCAGALQDGLSDNLAASQHTAMLALYEAAGISNARLVIQISARTDGAAAETPFLATKRRADQALKASAIPYVIFRPALVIGRNAFGGTALIRGLASFPLFTPLVFAESRIATTALSDVATAVLMAVDGQIAPRSDMDLAADKIVTLADLVALHRQWLGLPGQPVVNLPAVFVRPVAFCADLAGRLGWRSPLRSTAMKVMIEGVASGGTRPPLAFLDAGETLAALPSGVQDLWFARLYLLKPLILVLLSLFWLSSGIVPFFDLDDAARHFLPLMDHRSAIALVMLTSVLDILLGALTLFRPKTRLALMGQILTAAAYLVGGSLLEPALWLDPLGPYVKILPAILLSGVALAILDER